MFFEVHATRKYQVYLKCIEIEAVFTEIKKDQEEKHFFSFKTFWIKKTYYRNLYTSFWGVSEIFFSGDICQRLPPDKAWHKV